MKKFIVSLAVIILAGLSSLAQEGMWLLSQIDQLDLNKKGLEIKVSDIYTKDKPALYSAILQIGGGTGSFVSPDGLVLTNHHVAYAALQRSSSVASDFITKGFLAANRGDEMKAPGYRALMLTGMKDVTDEVLEVVKGISDPTEKDKKINAKIAAMTDAIEKDKKDVQARVAEMYNGRQYILYVYKQFKDIRIVYSPPLSIGNFGGEIDNWM